MNTSYATFIASVTPLEYDVRHVEAYIRLAHPTLDGLSYQELREDIRVALMCIKKDGTIVAERLAQSYGL